MKKSFVLLPLVAAMALTGCSSDSNSAEVTDVNSGSAISTPMPSWQSSEVIESTSMPASMSSAPSQTIGQAQTTYNNAQTQAQSTYNSAQTSAQTAYQSAQTSAQSTYNNTQAAASNYASQSESVGNCQIVRDTTGTPVYTQMVKGCYTDANYTVGKSDTIYLISFLAGKTPAQIASLNNISTSTKLTVGQVLRVQ